MNAENNNRGWKRDATALAFAMLFPSLATWLYFVVLSGREAMQPVYFVCKGLQAAFPLLWVWGVQRQPLRPAWPSRQGLGLGLAFGGLVLVALLSLYYAYLKESRYLATAHAPLWEKLQDLHAVTPGAFLRLAAFIAVLHSLFEEYYWRWFVFGQLRRRFPTTGAVALSSLTFALHHVIVIGAYVHDWPAIVFFTLSVAVGGAVWAWLYQRTNSLYGPWLSHLLVDAGLMWIGYDLCARYWP